MPDILVKETARPAPALSAVSDTPETRRKAAQQSSDFAALKEPPARSTTTTDTASSSSTTEEEEALDALDHDTTVRGWGTLDAVSAQAKPTEFVTPRPRREDFDDSPAYDAALMEWGANKGLSDGRAAIAQQEQRKIAEEALSKMSKAYVARQGRAAKRISDYAKVMAKAAEVPITVDMARTIMEDPNAPYVEYALNKNPAEAARIAALPPRQQVAELAKFAATVKPSPQTSARSAPSSKVETMEQYAARRNKEIQEQRAARYGGVFRK